MKKFKLSELLFRVPFVVVGIWLVVKFIFNGQYVDLLTFLLGAAAWEYVLFFLTRLGILNIDKYWNNKDEDGTE